MKSKIYYSIIFALGVLTACSSDDETPVIDSIGKSMITEINYTNTAYKDRDRFEYDQYGRIVFMEINDSTTPIIDGDPNVPRNIKVQYTYSDNNDRIYIKNTIAYSVVEFESINKDNIAMLYDTLFINNNRIDSIHAHEALRSNHDRFYNNSYKFEYSDNNQLAAIKTQFYMAGNTWGSPDKHKTLNVTWQDNNLTQVLIDGNRAVHDFVPDGKYQYSDVNGFLPTYNVFTLELGIIYGILAQQGLFGTIPTKLLSRYMTNMNSTWENPRQWYSIEYSYYGDRINSCTEKFYYKYGDVSFITKEMAINWRLF